MATAVQIQNCKKIFHEEVGQNDIFDKLIELSLSKIKSYKSADELFKDPEIVAFCKSKNLPSPDIDVETLPPSITSFEEAFRYGFLRGLYF